MRYEYTLTYLRHYTPDSEAHDTVIELKGRFRTLDEARKYLYIRDELRRQDKDFMFVFFGKNTPMPGARVRKDGTKRTMEEWANEHDFYWIYEEELEAWLNRAIPNT